MNIFTNSQLVSEYDIFRKNKIAMNGLLSRNCRYE